MIVQPFHTLYRVLRLIAFVAFVAFMAASPLEAQTMPLSYECHRTTTPIRIDGNLDDPAWKQAKWTSDFVDIQGAGMPEP